MPRPHRFTTPEYNDMVKIYEECQQDAKAALKKYKEKYGATRKCPGSVHIIQQALKKVRKNPPSVSQDDSDASDESEPMMQSDASEEDWLDEQSDDDVAIICSRKKVARPMVGKVKKPMQSSYSRLTKAQILSNPSRETFCHWILNKVSEDPNFLSNIMWTGESTFTVNHVQPISNRYYWGHAPPTVWPDDPAPTYVHVWAAIHQNEIIGPIFINGNLNATKFLDLLSGPIDDYVDQLPLDVRKQLWVQLNGLPAHSAPAVRERMTEKFGKQWIGRYGPRKWPAKSADLSPLELFLWKFIKNETYAKRTKDCVEELKKRIMAAFDKLKKLTADSDFLNKERIKVLKKYKISIGQQN